MVIVPGRANWVPGTVLSAYPVLMHFILNSLRGGYSYCSLPQSYLCQLPEATALAPAPNHTRSASPRSLCLCLCCVLTLEVKMPPFPKKSFLASPDRPRCSLFHFYLIPILSPNHIVLKLLAWLSLQGRAHLVFFRFLQT